MTFILWFCDKASLGRTNRVISFDMTHTPHRKQFVQQLYCPAYIHFSRNVFTKTLPSNVEGRTQNNVIS
jgi:hypothetical protein